MFFFFKQKTAYEMRISDWSSDVCSSDLRHALPVALVAAHENSAQGSAIVIAFLDAQRHAVAQLGEFADLDRCAERARAQFELQPLIGIAREDRKSTRLNSSH